jgi:serine phosphatase RsbU (regulator of sigma subunit)
VLSEDARTDPVFADKQHVLLKDDIGFYAGEPLRDRTGTIIGTFCIFDDQPRRLTPEQVVALRDLASWAERELRSEAEMSAAGAVQASMLPPGDLEVDGWHVAGVCRPALAVGGDFFDYGVAHSTLHVGMGDVMGKGTGAALLGAGTRAAVRGTHTAVTAGADLGVTVTHVARTLLPDLERAASFVTLFEAAVDLEDGLLRYVDAGMGLALLRHADGTFERLAGRDRPLGVLPDDHWTEHETDVGPGDRMLVFSDGLLDLLPDPEAWVESVGGMLATHDTVPALLAAIASLSEERVALDDVTAVAVYRAAR